MSQLFFLSEVMIMNLTDTITYVEYDDSGKIIAIIGKFKAGDLH